VVCPTGEAIRVNGRLRSIVYIIISARSCASPRRYSAPIEFPLEL